MRYKIFTAILVVLIIAVAVCAYLGVKPLWIAGLSLLMLADVVLCYSSMARPLRAVEYGVSLLSEQDFSSRLRYTGQPDADKIVELYNGLIDSMKAERLRNLEQDRFLSLVVEKSPMGIAVCDFDGNTIQSNPAWESMQSPGLSAAIEQVKTGESRTVRLADSLIVRISKLWFMDSGFRRRFLLVERLTEEIAAAEKQMFSKIVRTIGHEVNNTLGSVMSVLDTLRETHADDSFAVEAIDSSRNSCGNLVSFVRGYADIVKLPPVTPENVEIAGWLKSISPVLSGMMPENVELKLVHGEDECESYFDPMLMERVVINIVKNSIESIADRPGGLIEIAVRSRKSGWRIDITDNGPGIPEEVSSRLFTPFFSTKRPDRGLGLMLITDILRAHKFRFSLSTAPGAAGTPLTTFSIDLPFGR